MKTYVVTGATGNTGKPVAMGLLEKGHRVRIISRNAEKASALTNLGADLFLGDTTNKHLLMKAFSGADAVYAMIPFDMCAKDYFAMQMAHATAITDAIRACGVKHVVFLSSIGAHLKEGSGVVQGLESAEKMLNAIEGINVMHLRPAYFMENIFAQIGAIKNMGVMASAINGDMPIPMVATEDIAEMAVKYLLELDFKGINHAYVLGQRDATYSEVAKVFGSAIGMPDLKFMTVSPQDAKTAMMQMGLGESVADRLNEFIAAMHDGKILEDAKRTPENTTPTSIEQFAGTFAYVYNL